MYICGQQLQASSLDGRCQKSLDAFSMLDHHAMLRSIVQCLDFHYPPNGAPFNAKRLLRLTGTEHRTHADNLSLANPF